MPIESVMPSNHLILCHPLLLLPSIFPSIRVFSSESVLRIRWPKYWSFSFNISPSVRRVYSPWFSCHNKDSKQQTLKPSGHHSSWTDCVRALRQISLSKKIPGLISFSINGLAGSPCSPRDSQESSPTPQFKNIYSSALRFLHSPILTSIHDHRKNHSLD